MTAKRETASEAEPRITIDDLRHRAEDVRNKAVAEAKGAARAVVGDSATRTLVIVAGVVVVAASFAYFLGTRSRRRVGIEDLLGG